MFVFVLGLLQAGVIFFSFRRFIVSEIICLRDGVMHATSYKSSNNSPRYLSQRH